MCEKFWTLPVAVTSPRSGKDAAKRGLPACSARASALPAARRLPTIHWELSNAGTLSLYKLRVQKCVLFDAGGRSHHNAVREKPFLSAGKAYSN